MAQSTSSTAPRRGFKEFIRKMIVSLKRAPHNIAFLMMIAAFLVYSLNLSAIAKTTNKIMLSNMGLCEFVAMLLSMLALVCFLRAFPKREKPKVLMIALIFLMLAVLIFVDVVYYGQIIEAVTRDNNKIEINAENAYIAVAQNAVIAHIICVVISAVLLATLPLYSKAIRKINTSIDVEDNGEMEVIDISGEE